MPPGTPPDPIIVRFPPTTDTEEIIGGVVITVLVTAMVPDVLSALVSQLKPLSNGGREAGLMDPLNEPLNSVNVSPDASAGPTFVTVSVPFSAMVVAVSRPLLTALVRLIWMTVALPVCKVTAALTVRMPGAGVPGARVP